MTEHMWGPINLRNESKSTTKTKTKSLKKEKKTELKDDATQSITSVLNKLTHW